ncbi:MAG: hypothetical protein NT062_39305, partial [Proteobacteria bacterium]|nr:hypothetical protein [Pseudomonadota bacterium]
MRRAVLILVAMLGLARGVAEAEDLATYEVDGEAASAGSDPRVAALDDAFGRAASAALAELVPGAVRAAKKQLLDREIVGRARLWIAKFSVVKDETNDDRRQLTVSVRVDRDKMRARLTELEISTSEGSTPGTPAEPVVGKARPVVIMLRVTDPETSHVTFGANADKDVAGTAAIAGA